MGSRARPWFAKGVTQYLMLPNGRWAFSLSPRRLPGGYPEDELQLKMQSAVRLKSLMALMRWNDEMVMTPEMKFSKRREMEILKWTAEGKTSAEVAMILSISENTVNFHQKNMQKKFNAPNKTQIACYAVATGLNLNRLPFCVSDVIPAESDTFSRHRITDDRLV